MNVYEEIGKFYACYRGEKRVIGESALGRNIYAFFVGSHGGKTGICQYAIHAREWVTAFLGLEHIRRGVKKGGAWVIPLMNPDGAALCTEGPSSVADEKKRGMLCALNGGEDFSLWKANAEGVDLNVNFPARWGSGEKNVFSPAGENFIGRSPLCAPESCALARFTSDMVPAFTLSYHTKGEVIYWRFHQGPFRAARDRRLAKVLSSSTGYPLGEAGKSAGGYKDWCVERGIPAFTVEAGKDAWKHPLTLAAFPDILRKNREAVFDLSGEF